MISNSVLRQNCFLVSHSWVGESNINFLMECCRSSEVMHIKFAAHYLHLIRIQWVIAILVRIVIFLFLKFILRISFMRPHEYIIPTPSLSYLQLLLVSFSFPIKFMTSSSLIIIVNTQIHIYMHIYKYTMLSLFSVTHVCMVECLGLVKLPGRRQIIPFSEAVGCL